MNNRILKGAPLCVPKIEKGIGEYFFEKAEVYGNKIFQINGEDGSTESYLATKQRSTRVAVVLQKMGIKPKDVVMICCRNNPHNIIPALASLYLGAYVATVDPTQSISDAKHALSLVEPKVIFVEENSLPLIEESLEDFHLKPEIIVIGKSDKWTTMSSMENESEEEKFFKPIKQKSSDIVAILFSSGTTSAPKGILLSNSFVLNSAQGLFQHNHTIPGVFLHFASLYWVSTWLIIGLALCSGSSKLSAPAITAEKLFKLVDRYKVTYFFSSSALTYGITNLPDEFIKKYDTSSLYNICISGSTMEPQQMLKVRKLLPHTFISLGYGSTEGNCMVCFSFPNQKAYNEKVSSSGTVTPETQIKFVDLETGKLLGPNEEGELLVKSPFLMSGYHKFEKTDIYDEDGFFKTGDVGYYDEDEYIYVTDRIGEMFKYKTNHLSPSVLEHAFLTHPDVNAAVAFGVPHPVDRNYPAACVILNKEANVTVEGLVEFVNSKVPDPYQLRAGVMVVDFFPRTPSGKVQRRTIRDVFIKTNIKK